MKTIEAVSIWDNGTVRQATILNSYAVNVTLNTSATFVYYLMYANEDGSQGSQLAQGNLIMTGEAYTQWQSDNYAWDWIAGQLNLTITGDYVPPVPVVEETITEEPVATEEPIV